MSSSLKKPARIQVAEDELPSSIPPQNGLVFNLWYNKWSHGTNSNNSQRFLNKYKCNPLKDSGYTRADKQSIINSGNSNNRNIYYCLYFAKGCCSKGSKCDYYHHIPQNETSTIYDCFGREKFSDFRDDMGGVGSFNKQNKTLYIGGLTQGSGLPANVSDKLIEERIKLGFEQFGDIDYIRYIKDKNCCFIKFRYQSCAEFAKEAMSHQTLLTKQEIEQQIQELDQSSLGIMVKWAKDDPNPHVQKLEKEIMKRNALEKMAEILKDHNDRSVKRQLEIDGDITGKDTHEQLTNKKQKPSHKFKIFKTEIFNEQDVNNFQKRALRKISQRPQSSKELFLSAYNGIDSD